MEIIAVGAALGAAWLGFRAFQTPACPRCRARSWDRKLCRPLLLCRRCATRADQHGRAYN
jgi:hypothetical protein